MSLTMEQRRSNLAKLAKGLLTRKLKTDFDMGYFAKDENNEDAEPRPDQVKNVCGTACCALGHAPILINDTIKDETWTQYSNRTMPVQNTRDGINKEWMFLFGGNWESDKKQFAARAFIFLTSGVPADFDPDWMDDEYPIVGPRRFDQWIIK